MVDGFFEIDLLLQNGIRARGGVADANPVNDKGRIALAGGISDGRILIAVVARRVA